MTIFSLCLHMVFLLYTSMSKFSSQKDTSHIALGPTLMNTFWLNHACKDSLTNTVTFWVTRGEDYNIWILLVGGPQFKHNKQYPGWLRRRTKLNHLLLTPWLSRKNSHKRLHLSQDNGDQLRVLHFQQCHWNGVTGLVDIDLSFGAWVKNHLLLAEAVIIYSLFGT